MKLTNMFRPRSFAPDVFNNSNSIPCVKQCFFFKLSGKSMTRIDLALYAGSFKRTAQLSFNLVLFRKLDEKKQLCPKH